MSDETDKPVVKTAEETQAAEQAEKAQEVQTEKTEGATPELSPRARAEREVWARSNRERDIEAKEPLPPADGEAPPVIEETKLAAPAATETPAPAAEPEDPEIELIVSGKPMKVKQSQILDAGKRTLQKDAAADMKLEIASKLLREAEERAGKQPSAPADAQPPAQPSQPVQEKSDAELAELIQYGTKEQAATAIAEIRRRDGGAVNQQGLQEFISRQLPDLVSAQLAFHSAVREAQAEYKDIFADPHLTTLFHVQEHRARQGGDARPHAELYKEIGEGIRKHFKLQAPVAAPGPTLEQKREVKAATPSVPRAAATRADPGEGSERPLTLEQQRERAIDAMKKARGQDKGIRKY